MSRSYRITASESVRRHVKVADGICTTLELLEVLPQESMAQLLTKELVGRGFKTDGDKAVRDEGGGVEIEVDLKAGTVKVKAAAEADLEASATRSQSSGAQQDKAMAEKLRETARKAAEAEVDVKKEALRRAVTEKLERRLSDLQVELDGITHKVTAEALKVRAAQLGEIEEITEDATSGSMIIRVRT